MPSALSTRFADGNSAVNLCYAVYDRESGDLIYSSDDKGTDKEISWTFSSNKFDITFDLVNGKRYDFMFWADNGIDGLYNFDYAAKTMTVDYDKMAINADNADAFYNVCRNVEMDGAAKRTIELRRPFAQINLGTDDLRRVEAIDGTYVKSIVMAVDGAYSQLDLFAGTAGNPQNVVFTAQAPLPDDPFPVNKEEIDEDPYEYLAMGYILTGIELIEKDNVQQTQQEIMNVNFDIKLQRKDADSGEVNVSVLNCPVQRNFRTNIFGSLLTTSGRFNIIIEPDFESPDINIPDDKITQ